MKANFGIKRSWISQFCGAIVAALLTLPMVIMTTGCPDPIRPLCEKGVACPDTDSGDPVETKDTEEPTTGDPTEGSVNFCSLSDEEKLKPVHHDPDCPQDPNDIGAWIKDCNGTCQLLIGMGGKYCDQGEEGGGNFNCKEFNYDCAACPGPDDGCPDKEGITYIPDCNEFCTDKALLGNGQCNNEFECQLFDLDGGDCRPPGYCGDGVLNKFELCDGKNLNGETCIGLGHDGGELKCNNQCYLDTSDCTRCGNGIKEEGEQCDDGTDDDPSDDNLDGCLVTCKANTCGDGNLFVGVEACDDGNLIDGDGCSSSCKYESAATR